MASITCSDITKSYGTVRVIDGLDLSIADQQFVVFLGPSGCGKSTMLRMIAGLEEVTGGRIEIGGRDVTAVPPGERDVAMVFQSYALYPHMAVADNITFGLRRQGVARQEIRRRLDEVAGLLGIGELLKRRPRQLSGGQQQRVAMARAIIKTPKVFLFDEPLSNLDAKLREKLRTEIRKIHMRLDTTTIFVTHDQLEALTIADTIVLMRDGAIEQHGSPAEIFDRPANRFVADFIGSPGMNFLTAEIVADGEGPVAVAQTIRIPVPAHRFPGLAPGEKVELGLRPARMDLCEADAPGAVAGRVVLVENMGTDALVIADADGQELSFVTRRFGGLRPGDVVTFAVEPDHLHVFDIATGVSRRANGA